MNPTATTTSVTLRYWAAARAATGVDAEQRPSGSVQEVLDGACADHHGLDRVAAVASFLLDGVAVDAQAPVPPGATLDVLPPFAGG